MRQDNRIPRKFGPKAPEHNINEHVRHQEVRITGDGVESRIVSRHEALSIARQMGVDLVEIVANANPPVCRIIDYKKFLYEKKRKERDMKNNAKEQKLKEMQLTPNIGDHDVETKVKHAREWLMDGDKVRCVVLFKGRNIMHKDRGEVLLLKICQMLEDCAKVEFLPKLEGKKMSVMLAPKSKR